MPKERRRRTVTHEQSVRLPTQRWFAVQENAVEHVTVGEKSDVPAPEILAEIAAQEDEPRVMLKKKEKQALKHDIFLRRLEQSRSPYSKSHERRLKRKAREQVAGGMSDIKAALVAVEDEIPAAVQASVSVNAVDEDTLELTKPRRVKPKPGQIGEGKGVPLSKSQRKRALQLERARIPMILATPEFTANPFQTIRTHAQNTLLQHQPPAA